MSRATIYLTALIAAFLADPAGASAESKGKPNILMILVDDMGYGDAGCYNAESKIPTPNIDGLARDGMRFTDAHAPGPLCHLSRYGLMTGRYPFRADFRKWRKHPVIKQGRTTIASMLKAQGYRTAMVGKWHLGFEENGYDKPLAGGPVDVGFDSYFGIRASTDIPDYFYIRGDRAVMPPTEKIGDNNSTGEIWNHIQGKFWRRGLISPDLKLHEVLPRFTDEAIKVIDKHNKAKPLMLYLAYPAPHTPWLPSDEFVGKSKAGLYGDFTAMVDAEIGRVLGALEKTGMEKDTLVVFTSDNGPVWYAKDVERFEHDSVAGLRGMKADAWEGGHRMPFIVRWPGAVKAGSVSDATICFTDLLRTFASLTGHQLEPGDGPDSYDFSKILRGTGRSDRPHLAMKSGSGHMTLRAGDWKLIDALGSGGFSKPSKIKPGEGDPPGQLFNLRDDPAEANNLYLERADKVKELRAILEKVVRAES